MDIHGRAKLATHPLLDRLRLAHRDTRRNQTPSCRFISVGPVDRTETREHVLQPGDHGIALPHLGPCAAVNVETQDASGLVAHPIQRCGTIDRAVHRAMSVLRQADTDGRPRRVAEEGEVEMAFNVAAVGRCFVPRVDEARAFL